MSLSNPSTPANTDGWIDDTAVTWTYASATTFTIAGVDVTAKFSKGTRLRLTQTTVKYFVVVNSSFSTNTTVTITGGSDYTLANAAISANYYSYAVNPQGYPSRFAYTPVFTGFSADPSSVVAEFLVIGRMCWVSLAATAGTSNATTFTVTYPVPSYFGTYQPARITNNSAVATTPGMISPASATVLNVFRDWAATAWTNTGGKNAEFGYWYMI